MSEHTELIERLRNYCGGYDHEHDCHGAANVIEQLEAENSKLRELLSASNGLLHVFVWIAPLVLRPRVEEVKHQIAANERLLGGK